MPVWRILRASVFGTLLDNSVKWRILSASVTGTPVGGPPVPYWRISGATVSGTAAGAGSVWRILGAKVTGALTGSNFWRILSAKIIGTKEVLHVNPEFYIWDATLDTWIQEYSLYVWDNFAWRQIDNGSYAPLVNPGTFGLGAFGTGTFGV